MNGTSDVNPLIPSPLMSPDVLVGELTQRHGERLLGAVRAQGGDPLDGDPQALRFPGQGLEIEVHDPLVVETLAELREAGLAASQHQPDHQETRTDALHPRTILRPGRVFNNGKTEGWPGGQPSVRSRQDD